MYMEDFLQVTVGEKTAVQSLMITADRIKFIPEGIELTICYSFVSKIDEDDGLKISDSDIIFPEFFNIEKTVVDYVSSMFEEKPAIIKIVEKGDRSAIVFVSAPEMYSGKDQKSKLYTAEDFRKAVADTFTFMDPASFKEEA